MADTVLLNRVQLSHGQAVLRQIKHRIVAKAALPARPRGNHSLAEPIGRADQLAIGAARAVTQWKRAVRCSVGTSRSSASSSW